MHEWKQTKTQVNRYGMNMKECLFTYPFIKVYAPNDSFAEVYFER